MKVFVYGTLKRGGHNNHFLKYARYMGEATSDAIYALQDCGFPYAVPDRFVPKGIPLAPIKGEIFEVVDDQTLSWLDRLEGEGSHYHRRVRFFKMNDTPVSAYIYERDDFDKHLPLCEKDEEGRFVWAR